MTTLRRHPSSGVPDAVLKLGKCTVVCGSEALNQGLLIPKSNLASREVRRMPIWTQLNFWILSNKQISTLKKLFGDRRLTHKIVDPKIRFSMDYNRNEICLIVRKDLLVPTYFYTLCWHICNNQTYLDIYVYTCMVLYFHTYTFVHNEFKQNSNPILKDISCCVSSTN